MPAATADLHSLLTLYECQRKVIVHNAFSFANARRMIEMALVLRGSREAVAQRPPYRQILPPISPLFLNEDDTTQLLLCCEYGIPTDIPIMPYGRHHLADYPGGHAERSRWPNTWAP